MKLNIFRRKTTKGAKPFFALPKREQKGIVLEAIKEANKLQEDLFRRYERSLSR